MSTAPAEISLRGTGVPPVLTADEHARDVVVDESFCSTGVPPLVRTGQHGRDARAIAEPPTAEPMSTEMVIATVNRQTGNTGVHTHTHALQQGMSSAGVPCALVTPFSGNPAWLPVFAVRRIFGRFNRSWGIRWYRHWHEIALRRNLARHLTARQPGVILAQCPVSASAALHVRSQLGIATPIAMVCHFNFSEATEYRELGELDDEPSYQEMLNFERRVLGAVDRVIYVSHWAKGVVERERGIEVRRSSVIWNGITGLSGARPVERAEIGVTSKNLVLMNVGTLEPRKNQLGLIDLFAMVTKVRPDARLVLVGDGPHRGAIERKIAEHGLGAQVSLLGTRRDVPALLAAADVYVHYAGLENCPIVLMEAARAGLPIAAVAGGGVPELLTALGGVPLRSSYPAEAFIALKPLLADSSFRRSAGTAAFGGFVRSFTREAMVESYMKVLNLAPAVEPAPFGGVR